MNTMPLVSSTAVLACATACVVTLMSTAAFGACRTTLRGELVAVDPPDQRFRVVPTKLLFFSLHELREKNGLTVEELFQSFPDFQNAKTTFPIPFTLNVDSPRDCPKELTLWVQGSDYAGLHYGFPINGRKKISLEKPEFESVRVSSPSF
jgi:hypothetical protein